MFLIVNINVNKLGVGKLNRRHLLYEKTSHVCFIMSILFNIDHIKICINHKKV